MPSADSPNAKSPRIRGARLAARNPGTAPVTTSPTPAINARRPRAPNASGALDGLFPRLLVGVGVVVEPDRSVLAHAVAGALARIGDHLVGRQLLGQPARLHAEVRGLRVVGDDRDRRLLRLDGVAAGQAQPDLLGVQQLEDLLMLGLLRAGRVAPRVAAALGGLDLQLAADLGVQPLGGA